MLGSYASLYILSVLLSVGDWTIITPNISWRGNIISPVCLSTCLSRLPGQKCGFILILFVNYLFLEIYTNDTGILAHINVKLLRLLCLPSCNPSSDLRLVIEVQAASGPSGPSNIVNPNHRLTTRAWTKLDLFAENLLLLSGYWKVPLRMPPINPQLSNHDMNSLPQVILRIYCGTPGSPWLSKTYWHVFFYFLVVCQYDY